MPVATYELHADWDGSGTFGDSTMERLTSLVDGPIRYRVGRDYASLLRGRSVGGRLEVTLDNDDSVFSTFNASSPVAGQVHPGVPVRLTTTAPVATTLWSGFLDEVRSVPGPHLDHRVTLVAVGPLTHYYAQNRLDLPMRTAISTGDAMSVILDQAGVPADAREIDAGQTTMARWSQTDAGVLDALRAIEDTEGGFVRETPSGAIAFEDRHHRLSGSHQAPQAVWRDDHDAVVGIAGVVQRDGNREVANRFETDVVDYAVDDADVLWTYTGGALTVLPGASVEVWAEYPGEAGAGRAIGADTWTPPEAGIDYQVEGPAASAVTVATTPSVMTLRIVFTNSDATLPAIITALKARGQAVRRLDTFRVVTEDAASQAVYGPRIFGSRAKFLTQYAEAEARNQFGLSIYKDPIRILAVELDNRWTTATLEEILTRQVSDRVTVDARVEGLGVDEDFFVESIKGEIDLDRTHRCTYELSPAIAFGGFLILDHAVHGTLDTGNRLAY